MAEYPHSGNLPIHEIQEVSVLASGLRNTATSHGATRNGTAEGSTSPSERRTTSTYPRDWYHLVSQSKGTQRAPFAHENRVECDHGRLKARLRPMRGLKTDRTAGVVIAGHAFVQNLRRGFYELGVEAEPRLRVAAAFDELKEAI